MSWCRLYLLLKRAAGTLSITFLQQTLESDLHAQGVPTLVEAAAAAGSGDMTADAGQQADGAEPLEQDEFDLADLMAEEIEVRAQFHVCPG